MAGKPCGRTPERLEVDAVVEALILAAVATDVLVDPALPLGHQFLGFLVPVPVGRPPGLNGVGAAVGEAAYPVGEILAVGACGDLVGGACPVVAGGDDAAYQLRGVVAGARWLAS